MRSGQLSEPHLCGSSSCQLLAPCLDAPLELGTDGVGRLTVALGHLVAELLLDGSEVLLCLRELALDTLGVHAGHGADVVDPVTDLDGAVAPVAIGDEAVVVGRILVDVRLFVEGVLREDDDAMHDLLVEHATDEARLHDEAVLDHVVQQRLDDCVAVVDAKVDTHQPRHRLGVFEVSSAVIAHLDAMSVLRDEVGLLDHLHGRIVEERRNHLHELLAAGFDVALVTHVRDV